MPSDADFYGGSGAPQLPVIESDDVLESQEPGEEPEYEEVSDTTNPESDTGVETSDFDFFSNLEKKEQEEAQEEPPGPAEISKAFDNLTDKVSKEEDTDSEGEEEEEQEGDDTLFK